jgi:SAM-dependent methyltransferase
MDRLTERNRNWLEERYTLSQDGCYVAHQPIYGYGQGATEPHHAWRFCRTLNILRSVLPLDADSILDVGGAEGYAMSLARHLIGCEVVTTDLSTIAGQRAREFWGLRAAAVDAAELPFADSSFDLVWCSEVIEHLARPFGTLAELMRVAKRYLLITTASAYPWALHREAYLLTRDASEPHFDRNIWIAADFYAVFGDRCVVRPQYALGRDRPAGPVPAAGADPQTARRRVLERTAPEEISARTEGLIVIADKTGEPIPPRVCDRDEEILDLLFRGPVHACPRREDLWTPADLRCPDCRSGLTLESGDRIVCPACRRFIGLPDDVLDLLPRDESGYDARDERAAVRELVTEAARQAYLLRLVDRFDTGYVAGNRVSYTFYRVLRRLLREIRRFT